MTAIMHEKLFEPYTLQGQHLEGALKYLANLAAQKGITSDVVELAVNEIFAKVANGYEFSTTQCSCGCGIDKASTDITHAIRDRMFEIDKEKTAAVKKLMQKRYQNFLVGEMQRISTFEKDRAKLMKGTLWERLTDWPCSWIYCYFKGGNYKKNQAKSKLKRVLRYTGK